MSEGINADQWSQRRDGQRTGVAQHRPGSDEAFAFVPGELLVLREAADDIAGQLRDWGHPAGVLRSRLPHERPEDPADDGIVDDRLPFARIVLADSSGADLDELVANLRDRHGDVVAPNHIFAAPHGAPNPAGPPAPSGDGRLLSCPPGAECAPLRIGVLDSGVLPDHPFLRELTIETEPHDLDVCDADDNGELDWDAGHGTFIAGVIRQLAPGATVVADRVFDRYGTTSEDSLAHAVIAMADRGVDVINLSLGGYTHHDKPPVALAHALTRVPAATAIVASSGNNGAVRPQWPAAFPRVVAVGAIDGSGERASFSDYGAWVDACAVGTGLFSSFLTYKGPMAAEPDAGIVEFDGYASWNGTSFAAPQFAAAVALVARRKRITPAAAASQLLTTGVPVAGLGVRFDLAAALA